MLKTVNELNEINASQENTEIYLFATKAQAMSKETLLKRIDVHDWVNSDKGGFFDKQELKDKLKSRLNLESLINREPLYALAVQNDNLRLWPTKKADYHKNCDIDYWSIKRVKIGERLLVWHYDKSNNWCFVQTNNAWGWLKGKSVAYLDSEAWIGYGQADFVQIVAPALYIAAKNGTMLKLYYATKLLLAHMYADKYQVILPKRDVRGNVIFEMLYLPQDENTNLGYLPLSNNNVVRQGFKFIGEKYDWGGKNGGHDCTSLISDLYASFGVIMPHNSYKQLLMPDVESLPIDLSLAKRRDKIASANIGSVLLFKGHGMIYTGEKNEKLTILHSVYRLKEGLINQTTLGTLEQKRENDESLLGSIEGIWDIWA